jgi:glycosyltransferase involved in cell wall biosynthesis
MIGNKKPIDILFAGFIVDDSMFSLIAQNDDKPQYAAHRFQKSLLDMMFSANFRSITAVGSAPMSFYPNNKIIYLPAKKWFHSAAVGYVIPTYNLPIIRSLTRLGIFLSFITFWALKRRKIKSKKIIFIYALHTPHLLASYIASRILNIHAVAYIPDLPMYMNADEKLPFLKSFLKKIDTKLLLLIVNKIDGRVVITENMFEFIKRDSSMVLDSISLRSCGDEVGLQPGKYLLYAGGLNDSNGIKELVSCFLHTKIKSAGLSLVLCGQGPLSDYCSSLASENENITYLGSVRNEYVVALQKKAFALINLRKSEHQYTKYSFPSKIAEYIQSGVPAISTRLLGIPSDLERYLIYVENDPVETLLSVNEDYMKYKLLAEQGREYYLNTRSPKAQAKRFCEYINKISGD